MEYTGPGNVRELENLIKRTVILGTDEPIRRELADAITRHTAPPGRIPALSSSTLPPPPTPAAVPAAPEALATRDGPPAFSLKDIARQAARTAEREMIARTLLRTRWNRREAAQILGISYKALLYKIKDAELDRAS
jgi:two-component system response regulator AtoC